MEDLERRFKEVISGFEQAIQETQELIEFCDNNPNVVFEDEKDWILYKSKLNSEIKSNTDALIAGLAKLDQLQAERRKNK